MPEPRREVTLDEVRQFTPDDADVIDRLAAARVFFYDGPGVIMPSGRRLDGAAMRGLVAEAGYSPLGRDGDRNDPDSPKHWSKDDGQPTPVTFEALRRSAYDARMAGQITEDGLWDRLRRIAVMEQQQKDGDGQ